jgi:hypothetical protein
MREDLESIGHTPPDVELLVNVDGYVVAARKPASYGDQHERAR